MIKVLSVLTVVFLILLSSCLSTSAPRPGGTKEPEADEKVSETKETGIEEGESKAGREEIVQKEAETPKAGDRTGGSAQPVSKEEAAKSEESKPEQEKKRIPVLTIGEIRRRVKALIKPPFYQVTIKRLALVRLEDLNLDGIPEILVPCVKVEEEAEEGVDTDRFSDFSSLFGKNSKSYPFYLYTFQMEETGPVLVKSISLGSRAVYGGIARFQIREAQSAPFVIVVKFQTQEGVEQEWLAFDGESILPISRLSLRETFSSKLLIEDIDGDGGIDIVVQEKGSEEGIGLETFLTWYRWDGRQFAEHATANIVRSLKAFLTSTKEYFLDKNWKKLVAHAFLPEDVKRYYGQGMSTEQIILKAFGLGDYYDTKESSAKEILQEIQEIVFPEFLENPFIARDDRGSFFRLTFRILDTQGISIISEIPLYMQKNPFVKRQFFFKIH
jgi:hypothetical protein